ncbi:Uncharacterized conserved protein, DUF2252 family [Chitinophaga jiangningensis]|uniref:Uncharacterized conserved protein, DUF2252 family n=1 Tax=Chitinophaga jiangningensis TaxID=1419482 RepID=A0A1M6W848_9BACT|nr:DUF2252 family protein [Chitinophaga jiangningensis]SHK89867.1 Uncharacterized conserved protein, DUF2252 family [Chitinophaga jiangningensis]
MQQISDRIIHFNEGRIPALLSMKYAAMRRNPLRFFRGSCHLFYEDLPAGNELLKSPRSWICGDLHLENFGSYKADNHIPYFDINDFDEAVLAPCLLDPARLLCSIFLTSDVLDVNAKEAKKLAGIFIKSYADTLTAGYIRSLEKQAATGTIRLFLDTVRNRKLKPFLAKRMYIKEDKPRLLIDDLKTIKTPKEERDLVKAAVNSWAAKRPALKGYNVVDAAYRIAGTGSLGIERYVLLVTYDKAPGEYHLLDLKRANPSCILKYHHFPQPVWTDEAHRITEVQKRVQAAYPALLHAVNVAGEQFVLKQLQPSSDKLNFELFAGNIPQLEEILTTMGQILGWDCLRSGGRQGSAIADELIDFGGSVDNWKDRLYEYAASYAEQVQDDFKEYAAAYDDGVFK